MSVSISLSPAPIPESETNILNFLRSHDTEFLNTAAHFKKCETAGEPLSFQTRITALKNCKWLFENFSYSDSASKLLIFYQKNIDVIKACHMKDLETSIFEVKKQLSHIEGLYQIVFHKSQNLDLYKRATSVVTQKAQSLHAELQETQKAIASTHLEINTLEGANQLAAMNSLARLELARVDVGDRHQHFVQHWLPTASKSHQRVLEAMNEVKKKLDKKNSQLSELYGVLNAPDYPLPQAWKIISLKIRPLNPLKTLTIFCLSLLFIKAVSSFISERLDWISTHATIISFFAVNFKTYENTALICFQLTSALRMTAVGVLALFSEKVKQKKIAMLLEVSAGSLLLGMSGMTSVRAILGGTAIAVATTLSGRSIVPQKMVKGFVSVANFLAPLAKSSLQLTRALCNKSYTYLKNNFSCDLDLDNL